MVGRGLWWHGGSGAEFGGFACCFSWWLCDVVVVGCVVDGGWWLLVVLLMVDQWVMVLLMMDWWVVIGNFGWIGGWLCSWWLVKFLCWVCLGFRMSFCIRNYYYYFLINCVGVFGLHGGDGGEERERHKYILLCKYIILMYCIRK